MFVYSSTSLLKKQQMRIAKQNLNLSGQDIVNYIENDGDSIKINEKEYLESVENMLGIGEIIGGVFCYKDRISVLNKEMGEKEVIVDISLMNDFNKRNTVNNFINDLLEKENFKTDVNIAVENEEDCLTETLFNKLEDYTVFIIGKIGKNVFLSGFVLEVI